MEQKSVAATRLYGEPNLPRMLESLAMLALRSVSKSYQGQVVIHPLDLTFPTGRTVALIGPSGCGKSTLLKILVGLLRPQSGQALFEGTELVSLSVRAQKPWMQRIGMTFQNSGLFDSLSCGENLSFALEENRVPKREWKDRVAMALSEVGLTGIEALRTHEISGGMK